MITQGFSNEMLKLFKFFRGGFSAKVAGFGMKAFFCTASTPAVIAIAVGVMAVAVGYCVYTYNNKPTSKLKLLYC